MDETQKFCVESTQLVARIVILIHKVQLVKQLSAQYVPPIFFLSMSLVIPISINHQGGIHLPVPPTSPNILYITSNSFVAFPHHYFNQEEIFEGYAGTNITM